MSQPKVLVSDKLDATGIDILKEAAEVDVHTTLIPEELVTAISAYDALVVRSKTKVTAEIIAAAERLRIIGRAGVGVDNIDVPEATGRGIVVVNSPYGNTVAVAEHAISMLTALPRRLAQAHASTAAGKWEKSAFMGCQISGKTLGIIGMGRIGSEVARRARGLEMQVLAADPFLSRQRAQQLQVELVELDELLERADFVSIHVPLSDATRNLIDKAALAKLRPGAYLINTSRGGIVNEDALAAALESKHLAGAALDVFEREPLTEGPLCALDNVLLTPHIGASTHEAQRVVAEDVARQIVGFFKGLPPRHPVNVPAVPAGALESLAPYISLAERIGRLHNQMLDGRVASVHLEYAGKLGPQTTDPIKRAYLSGLLANMFDENVNPVNAPLVASERGIQLRETTTDSSRTYSSLFIATVETDRGSRTIGGTVFVTDETEADGLPRIVLLEGFRVGVAPAGVLLLVRNIDQPGLIGSVGTILGNAQVNIAGMEVGRTESGGQALMILHIDSPVPDEVLAQLREQPMITEVLQVDLGDTGPHSSASVQD